MSETHRQYELAYVVSPAVTDDGVNELHERITDIVQQLGGTVDNTDNWGRRRLAYEINRHREGTYVIVLITGPGDMVTELERRLRVMEQLLRHLVIRVDEVMRKAARKRSRRQQRRKGGKGIPAAAAGEPPSAAEEPPSAPEAEAAASDAQPEESKPEETQPEAAEQADEAPAEQTDEAPAKQADEEQQS